MDERLFEQHDRLERDHWWFRGRRAVVLDALSRALRRTDPPSRLLDVGCGTGETLLHLGRLGHAFGVEPSSDALSRAARKAGRSLVAGALPHLPFPDGTFDAVTALDVLEHLDDDALGVLELARVLAPGGVLLVTVPALRALWSAHDVVNRHRRRYRRRELRALLAGARLEVERLTYFNSLLLPPIAVARWLGNAADRVVHRRPVSDFESSPPGPVNELLAAVFGAERRLLARGDLPLGVSLLAVARRLE